MDSDAQPSAVPETSDETSSETDGVSTSTKIGAGLIVALIVTVQIPRLLIQAGADPAQGAGMVIGTVFVAWLLYHGLLKVASVVG